MHVQAHHLNDSINVIRRKKKKYSVFQCLILIQFLVFTQIHQSLLPSPAAPSNPVVSPNQSPVRLPPSGIVFDEEPASPPYTPSAAMSSTSFSIGNSNSNSNNSNSAVLMSSETSAGKALEGMMSGGEGVQRQSSSSSLSSSSASFPQSFYHSSSQTPVAVAGAAPGTTTTTTTTTPATPTTQAPAAGSAHSHFGFFDNLRSILKGKENSFIFFFWGGGGGIIIAKNMTQFFFTADIKAADRDCKTIFLFFISFLKNNKNKHFTHPSHCLTRISHHTHFSFLLPQLQT